MLCKCEGDERVIAREKSVECVSSSVLGEQQQQNQLTKQMITHTQPGPFTHAVLRSAVFYDQRVHTHTHFMDIVVLLFSASSSSLPTTNTLPEYQVHSQLNLTLEVKLRITHDPLVSLVIAP